jgi:hypothetical protein
MDRRLSALAIAAAAVLSGQTVLAADAPKAKPKAGDCYEAGTAPVAKSEKSRDEVKKDAMGATAECEASAAPKATSEKTRAQVKEETLKATKSGDKPRGEATQPPKK